MNVCMTVCACKWVCRWVWVCVCVCFAEVLVQWGIVRTGWLLPYSCTMLYWHGASKYTIVQEHIVQYSLALSSACLTRRPTPRRGLTQRGPGSNRLRHAASVSPESHNNEKSTFRWSCSGRTRLPPPPRAFLPRLTEQHGADRWLDAPGQRVATLNGEENGMDLYGFLELAWRRVRVSAGDERVDSSATGRLRRGVLARGFAARLSCCDACAHRAPYRGSGLETPGVAFTQPSYVTLEHND